MTAAAGGGSVVAGNGPLIVGDKVEADYRGNGKYYPGKIGRVNNDGTYDVDYDDGEKESKVEQKLIRLVAKNTIVPVAYTTLVQAASAGTSTLNVASQTGVEVGMVVEIIANNVVASSFAVGDKVEANYHGNGRHYPGKISRVNHDNTYDVDYDDGEKETNVGVNLVRSLAPVSDVRRVVGFGSLLLDAPLANSYFGGASVKVSSHLLNTCSQHCYQHMLSSYLLIKSPYEHMLSSQSTF